MLAKHAALTKQLSSHIGSQIEKEITSRFIKDHRVLQVLKPPPKEEADALLERGKLRKELKLNARKAAAAAPPANPNQTKQK